MKSSFLLNFGIIVLIAVAGYSGYLFWQRSSLQSQLTTVEKNLAGYSEKILQYENKQVLGTINAKEAYLDLKEETIEWSKIIQDIQKTIPKKKGENTLEILSYSGSSSNEISMNVQTNPERKELYIDVADFIKFFDKSKSFAGSFVPSISSGLDEEGREILNFIFNTKYVKENISSVLPAVKKEELKEALTEIVEDVNK